MDQVTLPKELLSAPNFIGGEWSEGSGSAFDVVPPWFGKKVGQSRESTAADLDKAVAQASAAFPAFRASSRFMAEYFVRDMASTAPSVPRIPAL